MVVEAGVKLLRLESMAEASCNCIRSVAVKHIEVAVPVDTRVEDSCFFHRHLLAESIYHFVVHCNIHHLLRDSRRSPPHPLDLDDAPDLYNCRL